MLLFPWSPDLSELVPSAFLQQSGHIVGSKFLQFADSSDCSKNVGYRLKILKLLKDAKNLQNNSDFMNKIQKDLILQSSNPTLSSN